MFVRHILYFFCCLPLEQFIKLSSALPLQQSSECPRNNRPGKKRRENGRKHCISEGENAVVLFIYLYFMEAKSKKYEMINSFSNKVDIPMRYVCAHVFKPKPVLYFGDIFSCLWPE